MKKRKINIKEKIIGLLSIIFLSINTGFAQYSGGDGDGYESAISPVTNFSALPTITIPDAPIANIASGIGGEHFYANWSISNFATKYFLDVDDNSDFSSPLSNFNNLDVGNTFTYFVSGLDNNTAYYYRVRAYNYLGTSSNSNVISLETMQIELSISGISISNKPYDGNSYASISGTPILNGVKGADNVSLISSNVTALFDNPNVGIDKPVIVTGFLIEGNDVANYSLIQPGGFTADITKATPIIIWPYPSDIESGTALSEIQLNATSNSAGTFDYNPAVGTILDVGNNQELKVDFTPNDTENYNSASKSVYINVTEVTGFVELKENQLIVFPNPAKNILNISGLSLIDRGGLIKLEITDLSGKAIFEKIIRNTSNTEYIDISRFKTGTYFIKLYSLKEKIVKSFIKG